MEMLRIGAQMNICRHVQMAIKVNSPMSFTRNWKEHLINIRIIILTT